MAERRNPSSAAELLFRGEHLNLMRRRGWEYAEHGTATESVMVVALTPAGEIVLVEEFRPSVDASVISLPAGLSGDEGPERPEEAARRELLEETGYASPSLQPIGRGPGSAGASSEMVTFFLAADARRVGEQAPADRDLLRVHLVAVERLSEWTHEQEASGTLVDPKIWAGLYLTRARDPGLFSGSDDPNPRP